MGRAIGVASAAYDSNAAHTVTVTFAAPLRGRPLFQVKVNGRAGGITDPAGNPLNSPSKGAAGTDYTFMSNQRVS